MNWFEGSIPDAINEAKRLSLVFVVVITGDDGRSTELLSTWDDPQVSEAAQSCCIAIKLDDKSDACVQFSQIYPVVCVPSSFFIGDNGVPLEVIASSVSAEELVSKITRVRQMHSQQSAGGAVPAPSPESISTSPALSHSGASDSQTTARPDRPAAETPSPAAAAAAQTEAQRESSVEEREEQQKKEGQKETKGEVERRKLGKELQHLKRKQNEDQTKRLLEERQKEKEQERAARERVRQQIALDRADRAARYARTVEEDNAAKQALLQARQVQQEEKREATLRQRSSVARLQFRLPDGSSISTQFPSQSRLQEARQFAQQEVGSVYGNFTMATMFPRREFTCEDLDKTLLELELTPSASIVLLPEQKPQSLVESSRSLWTVLGTVLYPLVAVWRFLGSFLFPSSPTEASAAQTSSSGNTTASDRPQRESQSKQSLEKQPKNFKKDGKVCRLRTQEDSEDENNTWNGNSTQQM